MWRSFLTEQRALVGELADLTAALADIRQPVLLIADPADTLIPVSTTYQLAAALPDARVQLVSQIGHLCPAVGQHRSPQQSPISSPHWTPAQHQPDPPATANPNTLAASWPTRDR